MRTLIDFWSCYVIRKGRYKRFALKIFTLLFIFMLFPLNVNANAGPVIIPAPPSYEIALLENCPITVEREKLTFDMRGVYDVYQTYGGAAVTADYKMYNPTDTIQSVEMVFPIIGTNFSQNLVASITANNQKISYQQMYGDKVSDKDQNGNIILYDYLGLIGDKNFRSIYDNEVNMGNLIHTISNKDNVQLQEDRNYYRILFYVFTVDFPPKIQTELTVSYFSQYYSDRTGLGAYDSSREHYMYILNPAKGWASFGGLDIEVIPDNTYPYLIDGTMDFQKTEAGTYIASADNLPENDLIFTMYDKPQAVSSFQFHNLGNIVKALFIIYGVFAVFIIIALIFIVRKVVKHFKNQKA